ncbi:hypothetical protein [Microbacterium jejuense]|uniref:hypothetical protein n=1 Tax=Microbacterium jejuense TaxID=1263637 RepID=UPI0031F01693
MTDAAAVEAGHAILDPIAAEYLERPEVDIGAMFGSEGLRVRGKVFAFLNHLGALVIKVPEAGADAIVAAGDGERMEMRGRVAREWVVVDQGRAVRWAPLMADAFAYLDEITP